MAMTTGVMQSLVGKALGECNHVHVRTCMHVTNLQDVWVEWYLGVGYTLCLTLSGVKCIALS